MVNINKFNVGDIVTVCIPHEYKDLYARIDDTVTHRITRIISFPSDNYKTKHWLYGIDNENIYFAGGWITLCDEDIEPIDIKYIIGI